MLDLSFRGRLCLTGADRIRFLHGQVTNDINGLKPGTGCYAAVVNAKGRMEADLYIYCLEEELLLDFEPGLTGRLTERLEKYIVADDVQVVDVAASYGLLSVQGPQAEAIVRETVLLAGALPESQGGIQTPTESLRICRIVSSERGEIYLANNARLGTRGVDVFVPAGVMTLVANELFASVRAAGGCAAGWDAFEIARVEAGVPRFGADMAGANFPQECGMESRAMSYTKGCYIGQEVLNRIHTMGHVNRVLSRLRITSTEPQTISTGDKLFKDGKAVGHITSIACSPCAAWVALGYVRTGVAQPGTELLLRSAAGDSQARLV